MDNHTDRIPPVQPAPSDVRPTSKHNYAGQGTGCNDLLEHIRQVCKRITRIAEELILRGVDHDQSKFSSEEYTSFVNQTAKLKDLVYGSDEYRRHLKRYVRQLIITINITVTIPNISQTVFKG